MIVYLAIASKGPYYEFMVDVFKAQMKVYPNLHFYFVYANPNQSVDVIEDDHAIYIKGPEGLKHECVNKTIKAIQYILTKHKDLKVLVRTTASAYFNVDNMKKEVEDLPEEATLFGIHGGGINEGGMAFGSYIVWNRKAVDLLIEKGLSTQAYKRNEIDDISFTSISKELGFKLLHRKKESKNIYDSIHVFTGLKPFDVEPDWIMFKQKTPVDQIRDVSDVWRYTEFIRINDYKVYQQIPESHKIVEPYKLIDASMREIDFLYHFLKFSHFDYNVCLLISLTEKNVLYMEYTHRLIIYILSVYQTNLDRGYQHLCALNKKLLFPPIEIRPEIFQYNYHGAWGSKKILNLFFQE